MGMGGARLSHNHERQYTYVMQSMMLWREVGVGRITGIGMKKGLRAQGLRYKSYTIHRPQQLILNPKP
jgi:hypothetical protein